MKKIVSMLFTRTKYDKKLALLYVLNVTDYIFTLILISSGLFIEANPVLSTNIGGVWGFMLKCVVPLFLLVYLHIRFSTDMPKHEKAVKILLGCILAYYIIINLFHIFWIVFLIYIL